MGSQMMRKVIHFDSEDNADKIKLALDIIFQGKSTVHDFINTKGVCIMLVEIDSGVLSDLRKFEFRVIDVPKPSMATNITGKNSKPTNTTEKK